LIIRVPSTIKQTMDSKIRLVGRMTVAGFAAPT
jgi:hypothetical protein